MKKLFFIACFIACPTLAAVPISSHAESPAEQLIGIMMSDTEEFQAPNTLEKRRNPNDYQNVYNLATQHPELLKGIIHNERTFAVLCVERGYADVLTRLINESYPVDLATACHPIGRHECETTVLHVLFDQVGIGRKLKKCFEQDYTERITALTKLIINKYPDLLDTPVKCREAVRQEAKNSWFNCNDLIPSRDLH